MRTAWLVFVPLAVGCSEPPVAKEPEPTKPEQTYPNSPILALGDVRLGDDLEKAKAAFPPPEGAEVADRASLLEVVSEEGWSWGAGVGTGFEAATKDGMVAALAQTQLDGPQPESALGDAVARFGEPTHRAESDNAAMLVWTVGEYARFFVLFKREVPHYGTGAVTIIGPAKELAQIGYSAEGPESFVESIEGLVRAAKGSD
jgi:hypothetical protein